jgi:hypothetical protein
MPMQHFVLLLLGLSCSSCGSDPACKPLLQYGPAVEKRLELAKDESRNREEVNIGRGLTPAIAERVLREVELLENQLPTAAKDEDLNVLVTKVNLRRASLEQALRDFLAIDANQLPGGLDSGATMPVRRGVVMSRNALVNLVKTSSEVCLPQP